MTTNLFRYQDENFSLSFEGHTRIIIKDMYDNYADILYNEEFNDWVFQMWGKQSEIGRNTTERYANALAYACDFLIQKRRGRAKDSSKERIKENIISLVKQL